MEKKTILRVKKQDMVACFTCPICNNLYDRATNISECLHTFCRKCIEDKFIVEKLKACPVCNVDLGGFPLDKLRADHTLDSLKLNIFKDKPESVKATTGTSSTVLKYSRQKKKKKYVPSGIGTSNRVSTSSREPTPEKLGEKMAAVSLNQISSLPVSKFGRNETRLEPEQLNKESEVGLQSLLNIEQDNGLGGASTSKGCIQKINNSGIDLGKSLSATDKEVAPLKSNGTALIVETAITNRPGGDTEEVPGDANENPVLVSSDSDTEKVVSGEKQKNKGKNKQENVSTPSKISGKKGKGKGKAYSPPTLRPRRQRNMNPAGTSSQAAVSVEAEKKVEASTKKVWLSLIAAEKQNTDMPILPQISPQFIRTDGNFTVSYVKKYLAQKLGLESEAQVEIWLRQEPVCSALKLHDLVDWWVQTTPVGEQKTGMVGSSAADFVMILHYSGSDLFE